MARYYATQYFTGDGQTTRWNISFAGARPDTNSGTTAWFKTSDVKAATIVQNADGTETETELTVSIVGPTQVDIVPAVGKDVRFKIYRQSEREYPLVDFQDYASLTATELDDAFRQTLYGVQELSDLATYSDIRSIRAGVVAQSSVDDAKAAVIASTEAKNEAKSATETANTASKTATEATAKVDGAVATANSAKETAEGIAGTADDARKIAVEARTTANSANATATSIDGKATQAITTANTAKETANSAATVAAQANSTANGVSGKADTAITTANTAKDRANSALSTAQGLDSKISDAQHTASNAKEIATQASNTAANANNAANEAKSQASAAQSSANELKNSLKDGAYMTKSPASVSDLYGSTNEAASTAQLAELRNMLAVDAGHNGNGYYVKYASGLLIMWNNYVLKPAGQDRIDWTYPTTAINDSVTVQVTERYAGGLWRSRMIMTNPVDNAVQLLNTIPGSQASERDYPIAYSCFAMGFWK